MIVRLDDGSLGLVSFFGLNQLMVYFNGCRDQDKAAPLATLEPLFGETGLYSNWIHDHLWHCSGCLRSEKDTKRLWIHSGSFDQGGKNSLISSNLFYATMTW